VAVPRDVGALMVVVVAAQGDVCVGVCVLGVGEGEEEESACVYEWVRSDWCFVAHDGGHAVRAHRWDGCEKCCIQEKRRTHCRYWLTREQEKRCAALVRGK
jgi:hypothetical protein